MILLILLALLVVAILGVGFTIHWLLIIAAVAALLFPFSFFTGTAGGRLPLESRMHPALGSHELKQAALCLEA